MRDSSDVLVCIEHNFNNKTNLASPSRSHAVAIDNKSRIEKFSGYHLYRCFGKRDPCQYSGERLATTRYN